MKHQKGDVQSASHAKMLFTLFTVFLKIGAFTFGGGYAMIPLIQDVYKRQELLHSLSVFCAAKRTALYKMNRVCPVRCATVYAT